VTDLIRRLRAALAVVRPVATAPSISEALSAVIESSSRTARRNLAELDALFVKATGRAKRADRARLFAQLLVLFDPPDDLKQPPPMTRLTGLLDWLVHHRVAATIPAIPSPN